MLVVSAERTLWVGAGGPGLALGGLKADEGGGQDGYSRGLQGVDGGTPGLHPTRTPPRHPQESPLLARAKVDCVTV
eukprot:1180889-Prorocentrum_minimum.AAC.7